MTSIPAVAIGSIVAALIAALISFVGLIISKEQKTSEFRQAWIDALRDDLTTYLTQVRGVCDGVAVPYKSLEKKVSALTPMYAALNRATFAINLRLNPDEAHAQSMLSSMSDLRDVLSDPHSLTPENIQVHESQLLLSAKKLLKSEWRRVKQGEPVFVFAKRLAGALVLIVALAAALYIARGDLVSKPEPAAPNARSQPLPESKRSSPPRMQAPPPARQMPRQPPLPPTPKPSGT